MSPAATELIRVPTTSLLSVAVVPALTGLGLTLLLLEVKHTAAVRTFLRASAASEHRGGRIQAVVCKY